MLKGGIRLDAPFGAKGEVLPTTEWGSKKLPTKVDPKARRLQLEKDFFDAADNLVEKTKALEEIKRDKLYRQVCETWEEYCETVLGQNRESVRLAFRALNISEKLGRPTDNQNRNKCCEPVLSEKDLHKMARLPDPDLEELLNEDLADLPEKIVAKTKARKAKTMPSKPTIKTPDLCDENKARIEKARSNIGFQKALKKWLDDSDM